MKFVKKYTEWINECHFYEMMKIYSINEGQITTEIIQSDKIAIHIKGLIADKPVSHIEATPITNADLNFKDLSKNTWIIEMVYVQKEYRNLGLFTVLMTTCEDQIKKQGGKMVILRPDDASEIPYSVLVSLYEKMGYEHYWEGVNYMYKWL